MFYTQNHLTVCKQMISIKYNKLYSITITDAILLYANEQFIFNYIYKFYKTIPKTNKMCTNKWALAVQK